MKNKFLVIAVLAFITISFISYKITYALYSDQAVASSNTFSSSNNFPTSILSPTISITPTATVTPTTIQLSPTAIPTISTTPTPSPTNIANHIVISEVQTATSGSTLSDFIEMYNPTSSAISLNNFILVKRTKTGTTDTTIKTFGNSNIIPSHGFYLWANSVNGFATSIGADVSTTDTLANDNSVALKDPNGLIVDAVAWGTGHTSPLIEGSSFNTNPLDNQSIERKAYVSSTQTTMTTTDATHGNGYDTDNNSTDFLIRATSQPQNSSSSIEVP